MARESTPIADIGLSLFLIAVCLAVLWETRKIPPGTFEPLGSAPVPQAIASLIVLLCLLVIIKALRQLKTKPVQKAASDMLVNQRYGDAFIVFLLSIFYCLALQWRLLDFALLSTMFLIASIGLLARFKARSLPWIIVVAVTMSYTSRYVFTQVFVVDLPGAY